MPNEELNVNCPNCQKKVVWNERAKFRPFCCERCQQIDLGAWANESYGIPLEPGEQWSEDSNLKTDQGTNDASGSFSRYRTQ